MPRPVGERPGHERSDQLKATSLQLRLKRVRVGRQEPPIAQLGPCVAGRSHLIEHLAVVRKRRLMREARHHAPGAWRVRDSYFAHGVRLTDGLITSHVKE